MSALFKGFPPFQARAFQTLCNAEGMTKFASPTSFNVALRPRLVEYSSSEEGADDVQWEHDNEESDEQAIEFCLNPCKHHPKSSKDAMIDESAHLESLQVFADDLDRGLRGVFPIQEIPYRRVFVLLLCWEQNDLNFLEYVKELENVFKKDFNYETDLYCIPSEDSYNQLELKLVLTKNKISSPTELNLFILYYGGHGVYSSNNKSIWKAWMNKNKVPSEVKTYLSPQVDWGELQSTFKKASCDILFILDCCYAGTMVGDHLSGTKELLASSGVLDRASGAQKSLYTRALTRELEKIKGRRCSALLLHELLYKNKTEHNLESTPQHVPLSNDPDFRSILLIPQPAPATARLESLRITDSASDASADTKPSILNSGSSQPGSDSEYSMSFTEPVSFTDVRVLIRVSLESTSSEPIAQEWLSWLKKRPPQNIGGITVSLEQYLRFESLYKSNSLLLLITMPVSLWYALPQNRAYSYIGVVRSRNLLEPPTKGVLVEKDISVTQNLVSEEDLDDTRSVGSATLVGSDRGDIDTWLDSWITEENPSSNTPQRVSGFPKFGVTADTLAGRIRREDLHEESWPVRVEHRSDKTIQPRTNKKSGLPPYQYKVLGRPNAFRVLRLMPAGDTQLDIDCEFADLLLPQNSGSLGERDFSSITESEGEEEQIFSTVWNKDLPKNKLSYETVSLCWGGEPADEVLRVHDLDEVFTLPISRNLKAALLTLRMHNKVRQLWIDAICINQEDTAERNNQVPSMNQIYGGANNICIWLGEESRDSKLAMDFIRHRVLELWKFDELIENRKLARHWLALISLMKRPWFSSRWAIQEIALSPRGGVIYCGKEHNLWQDFTDAVSLLVEVESATQRLSDIMKLDQSFGNIPYFGDVSSLGAALFVNATSNLFRKNANGQLMPLSSLEYLVCRLSVFEVAEPRDTIYALLAISRGVIPQQLYKDSGIDLTREQMAEKLALALVPRSGFFNKAYNLDYRLPIIDVFKDFIEFSILTADKKCALDILCRPWAPAVMKSQDDPNFLKRTRDKVKEQEKKKRNKRQKEEENEAETQKIEEEEEKDEEIPLPSWIQGLSGAAFEMEEHPTAGLRMERQNADPLVGVPDEVVRRNYTAAGDTQVDVDKLEFLKWQNLRKTNSSYREYSLFVQGFVIDEVATVEQMAVNGNIPYRWLIAGGWTDMSKYPPEEFWRTIVADRAQNGHNPPTYFPRACKESTRYIAKVISKRGGSIDCRKLIYEGRCTIVAQFLRRVQEVIWNRKLMRTKGWRLGLVPEDARPGFKICILYGCSVPVILEEIKKSSSEIEEEEIERYDQWYNHVKKLVALCELRYLRKRARKGREQMERSPRSPSLKLRLAGLHRKTWPTSYGRSESEKLARHPITKQENQKVAEGYHNAEAHPPVTNEEREFGKELFEERKKIAKVKAAREVHLSYYRLVGESYVHGMMNGEAIMHQNEANLPRQVFELR